MRSLVSEKSVAVGPMRRWHTVVEHGLPERRRNAHGGRSKERVALAVKMDCVARSGAIRSAQPQ